MGGVPIGLAIELRDALGLRRAVETGTFEGTGTAQLARVFDSVVTVELSPRLHAVATERLRNRPEVVVRLGDSRKELEALSDRDVPTFFFLDAHWNAGKTSGADDPCPVLGEIAALRGGHADDCVVIDDARFFLAAPPPPNDPGRWPGVAEIVGALQAVHPSHHIAVVRDQVLAVPLRAKEVVDRAGQQAAHHPVRAALRSVLGDRCPPWSPTRAFLDRQRRRISTALLVTRSRRAR